jgi:hypothetical protein
VPVIQLHAESRVGQQFEDGALEFDQIFFGHSASCSVDIDRSNANSRRAESAQRV